MANGFVGAGKVKIAAYSSGATFGARNFRDVGNTSKFVFSFEQDAIELKNYQTAAGGIADAVYRLSKASMAMDEREFTAKNFADALWGTSTTQNTTAITGEAHTYKTAGFVSTNRQINTTVAPVVKKGATTFNAADYTVSAGGIQFTSGALQTAGIVDGDAITIDYTPVGSVLVNALTQGAPDVSILFEGVNINTGIAGIARFHKVKLGVPSEIGLISEEFGTLGIAGTVQLDPTVSNPRSQYFEIDGLLA